MLHQSPSLRAVAPPAMPRLRWRAALALVFCLALAVAPGLADARAGRSFSFGGSSSFSGMGSRGSRTFEHNGAGTITRSVHPGSSYGYGSRPGFGYGYGGSFFSRHPFLTGLFGGWLGSMLFHGMGPFGFVFGGFFHLLIIALLIWFLIRLFSGGFAGRAGSGWAMPRSAGAAAAPSAQYRGRDTTVDDSDLSAFQAIHATVQEAWGRGDLNRLGTLMTPEMLGYFSDELTKNRSQGVQNVVSNVRLLKGDVTEAWDEGDLEYATAYLQWSATDYTVRLGGAPGMPDAVVGGDPRAPVEAEEMWTFVRQRGGRWLLSAIQQV